MKKDAKPTSSGIQPYNGQLLELLGAIRDKGKSARKDAILLHARQWLAQEKEAIKTQFLKDNDPYKMLAAHTALMDALLANFYAQATEGKTPAIALVATGGYGRAELFPYSDIDMLLLYDGKESRDAARIAEFILYLLWDLGLKVGQAHRTIEDAIEAAKKDMTIRTSLLDSRLVAGDSAIYAKYRTRFSREILKDSVSAFIDAKLDERHERHKKFGGSRYMLEPNVKEGKGGLRDLHTLWWLATYAYPIKSLHDLVDLRHLTPEEYATCDEARRFLYRVRIHLHYIAGRAEEQLTFDRQHELSIAMGFAHPSANYGISRFMRRYFVALRTVGNVTRIFCALLEDEKKRTPHNAFTWLWHNPWKLGGFKLDGQRLMPRHANMFAQNPISMLELFRVAQQHDLDIHPRALQLIARGLPRIDAKLQNDPKANEIFLDILLSDKGPEVALRRMSEAGVLGKFIPDFGRVIGMTQFNRYHIYTVDEHTLVALGILHAIEKGTIKNEVPLASDVIHRVRMKRVLYVALLCHDIAKGRGGDHSLMGEKIVMRLAARLGFSADEIATAGWLVRHHLLFTNTVFKRDVNDPKTISDFVAEVQNSERLKLLVVLTVADMRAVAPGVWNHWKGALMRDLYQRADAAMGTSQVELKKHQAAQFKQDLLKKLDGWSERDVDQYIEQGNPTIWTACDIPHHAIIARMLKQAESMALPLLIDTQHHYEHSITEITLLTADQHGLFSKIAGAVSLAGANIISAKIFTFKNGAAVEIFQVQDITGDVFDRADRLAKMSVYIEQVLSGELDLTEAFSKRRREYRGKPQGIEPIAGQVFIDNEASNVHTVIEITGQDRIGFLYHVTRAIADLGLSIATSHISTYGVQVADVFYVKDLFGMKITHEAKLRTIRETLLDAVNSPAPVLQMEQ